MVYYYRESVPWILWVHQSLRLHRGTFITHTQRMLVCQIFPLGGRTGKRAILHCLRPANCKFPQPKTSNPDPKPTRQSRGSLNQIEPQPTPVFVTFSPGGDGGKWASVGGRGVQLIMRAVGEVIKLVELWNLLLGHLRLGGGQLSIRIAL